MENNKNWRWTLNYVAGDWVNDFSSTDKNIIHQIIFIIPHPSCIICMYRFGMMMTNVVDRYINRALIDRSKRILLKTV